MEPGFLEPTPFFMEWETGFEPATFAMARQRSTS